MSERLVEELARDLHLAGFEDAIDIARYTVARIRPLVLEEAAKRVEACDYAEDHGDRQMVRLLAEDIRALLDRAAPGSSEQCRRHP